MKLATFKDGSRDGLLCVVARDLKTAHVADGIAPTLQAALDDWAFIGPQLAALSDALNQGRARHSFDFSPSACMAPLPRAYQWVSADGDADARDEPALYQGGGDDLLGPHDDIVLAHEAWGIDFDAQLAVITGDVPMGVTPDQAQQGIRLLALVNDVSLRNLMAHEQAKGCGFLQSKPASAFAPLAVTPDELGEAWKGGKVHLPLRSTLNGKLLGQPHAGAGMAFNFPQLIAHLCRTRNARAGSIVGSGALADRSNKLGYSSIAAKRASEIAADGLASTPFMLFGDTVRIDMLDGAGKSVFGAIEQIVKQAEAPKLR
jgi:fumarylacetoacetate (FAA) hydrolase